jgi:hypothetical protein
MTASAVWWSEFLATGPEVQVRFQALADFLKGLGLERDSFCLMSTTEELLERKSSGPVKKAENTKVFFYSSDVIATTCFGHTK